MSPDSRSDGGWTDRLLAPLVVAAAGIAIQLPSFNRGIVPLDEGHMAAVVVRLLDGELLYRDVDTGIFPAIYYLCAGLFTLFGSDLLVTRWAQLVLNVAIAVMLFAIARRMASTAFAALPAALYLGLVAVGFPVLAMFNYSALAGGFALLALLLLIRYLELGRRWDGVLCGLALAGCVLSKQNFGGLALVASSVALLATRSDSALRTQPLWRAAASIVAGGLAAALVVTSHFLWLGTLGDLIHSTVTQLFAAQMESFEAPYPPLFGPHPTSDPIFSFTYSPPTIWSYALQRETLLGLSISPTMRDLSIRLSYGLPLLLLFSAPLLWLATRGAARVPRNATQCTLILAPIFYLGLFPQAIWSHLAYVLAPVLLLAAPIGEQLAIRTSARRILEPAAMVVSALVLLAGGRIALDVARWFPEPTRTPGATLSVMPQQAAALRDAVAFVESCAEPGGFIFAAPDIPPVYLITKRRNPTPYALLIPGAVDGRLVIERLEEHRPPCAVYNPRMYPQFPPFEELFPEVTLYLLAHYEKRTDLGEEPFRWEGLVRRSPPNESDGAGGAP